MGTHQPCMAWDALGNLINRHDPCGSHANGNVTSDTSGRNFHYASFDKLRRVSQGTTHTEFHYGAGREKTLKRELAGSTVQSRTHYVGSVEVVWNGASPGAGSGQYRRAIAGVAIATWYASTGVHQKRYLHTDHLGSITAISNESGQVETWMGFDAWGQRRDADAWHPWQQPPAIYLNAMLAITPRGFTGHEHVDTAGIIHMNGRIYDPRLGRFLQADPFVEDTTTLNRYTYVHNNPLAYTDPSGYYSVGKFFKRNWRTIATIAVSVFAPYAGLGFWGTVGLGAGAGFITTGTIEGALIGAFTAGVFYGIGQYYQAAAQANAQFAELGWLNPSTLNAGGLTTGQAAMQALSHSLAGGTISTLQGGKFGHGFLSAGITKMSSPRIGRIGDPAMETAAAAVVGGTISRITGGKFANGAVTAAMAYAFNSLSSQLAENYDPEARNYHDYEFEFELCSMSESWCTMSSGYDALRRHAYPGQDPNSPVIDQGVYGVKALGVDLGDIVVTESPGTHSIFNVTAENHRMYEGHVQRQLVARDGTLYVRTHGAGNNRGFWAPATPGRPPVYVPGPVAAQMNQSLGPLPFQGLNRSMRHYMRPAQ